MQLDFLKNIFQSVSPELQRSLIKTQEKFFYAVLIVTALFMWGYVVVSYFVMATSIVSTVGILASLIHNSSYFFYKKTKSLVVSSYVLVLGGLLFQWTFAFFAGGFHSPTLIWLAVLPVIVGLLTQKIHAFIWMIISIVGILMMSWVTHVFEPQNYLLPIGMDLEVYIVFLGLILLISAFTIFLIHMNEQHHIELSRNKSQIRNLLRTISHDIASPLSVVEFSVKSSLKQTPEDKYLKRIQNASRSMGQILSQVRELDALDSGLIGLNIETVQLLSLIESVVDLFEIRIQEKNLTVEIKCQPEILVSVDQNVFKLQILTNLLTNAIKFSDRNGRIQIMAEPKEEQVILQIRDYGMGIEPERLQKYHQGEFLKSSSGTEKETGTGFGMSLIQSALSSHQATMTIESKTKEQTQGQDSGTLVTLSFPQK